MLKSYVIEAGKARTADKARGADKAVQVVGAAAAANPALARAVIVFARNAASAAHTLPVNAVWIFPAQNAVQR